MEETSAGKDASREWEFLPCWNQGDWGSPAKNRVRVQPAPGPEEFHAATGLSSAVPAIAQPRSG